uniref:Uncharacterized protein n=1 Tax=uncultured bacterium A1Q1_fos_25 TaxID=1256569 RepID=L7VX32_9BACT|nr:hypothetical protein [uncultured bacterium A1Q1_fos_25]
MSLSQHISHAAILSFVANELQIIRAARFKHAQRSTNG